MLVWAQQLFDDSVIRRPCTLVLKSKCLLTPAGSYCQRTMHTKYGLYGHVSLFMNFGQRLTRSYLIVKGPTDFREISRDMATDMNNPGSRI